MSDFENMLYEEIKDEILSWEEEGIYAISFFLESNELITYKDYSNLTTWSVSYNTEEDCDGAGEFDEERWNFAFWRQDEMMIIYFDEPNEVSDELFERYAEKGVTDFGEDVDVYNENKEYIGEEPAVVMSCCSLPLHLPKDCTERAQEKKHLQSQVLFSVIFAYGERYYYAVVLCCV